MNKLFVTFVTIFSCLIFTACSNEVVEQPQQTSIRVENYMVESKTTVEIDKEELEVPANEEQNDELEQLEDESESSLEEQPSEEVIDDYTIAPDEDESIDIELPEEEQDSYSEEEPSDSYYDSATEDVISLSKKINIGDDEGVLQSLMSSEPYYDDPRFSIYRSSPVSFYALDGKIALISWGRSGGYEDWLTAEGISRRSTYDKTVEAYKGYESKTYYIKGKSTPEYLIVDYHEDKLVFEFDFDQQVSFIFKCAPEILDELMVQNTAFTTEEMQETPFK